VSTSLFAAWPIVPTEDRPKRLPHTGLVNALDAEQLRAKGWDPQDVRLMPNRTDADRAECLKAYLEGIRLGTIEPNPKLSKFIEAELRTYGLSQGKAPAGPKSKTTDTAEADAYSKTLEDVLNFGSNKAWSSTADERIKAQKKLKGRPKDLDEE
jgi:hypothetical protein